jgi:hypothetical protein
VVDGDDALPSGSSFVSSQSVSSTETADFTLTGLKSHLVQNLTKKPKVPSGPFPPLAPLPSPFLCPRRTFLASLILASKFTQDRCYSNKAWAKLSSLPPREKTIVTVHSGMPSSGICGSVKLRLIISIW